MTTHTLVIIFNSLISFLLGFLVGRYFFWLAGGAGFVREVKVERSKTYRMQDFKAGTIYKAMVSALIRRGEINVETESVEQTKSALLKHLPKDYKLSGAHLGGKNWKITLIQPTKTTV